MDHALAYLFVFLGALAVDLVPFFGPPAWTIMAFLMLKHDLDPWITLAAGVAGSTLGRYALSLYVPRISRHVIRPSKHAELEFVGKKLRQKLWQSWLFVLAYSVLPLSTTALFSAAGMARISPLQVIPPFVVGKAISDGLVLLAFVHAAPQADDAFQGALSLKAIISAAVGLVLVSLLLFVDWRTLLQRKKLTLKFRIWK